MDFAPPDIQILEGIGFSIWIPKAKLAALQAGLTYETAS
jgi:hypothetical protein